MTPRSVGVALVKRLVVTGIIAVVIIAAAWAAPALTTSPTPSEPLDTPEYDPATLATEPIAATGEIEADASVGKLSGLVIIDDSHTNRFDRAEIAPLVEELSSLGYQVRFHDGDESLDQVLSNANAFVVIDPGSEFSRNELEDVREFTNEGGHLLMIGEPNRKSISASFFGTSISDQESKLTMLAGRYDMALGTAYLYNLETNGGNYKHLVARPTPESGLELDSVTMFTAAAVHSRGGTVLLRAAPSTHESGTDSTGKPAVAIHKENVVLVGDKTFLGSGRFNVGDNEKFVAYLVEFLISGERVTIEEDENGEEGDATNGEAGNGTVVVGNNTTSPTTPTADLVAPASGMAVATAPGSVADFVVAADGQRSQWSRLVG